MKQKIFIPFVFFILSTSSSFAVIDVKKDDSYKTTQHFKNDFFSKNKKIKKRKFCLRNVFVIKKKLKRVRVRNEKKESKKANWSLGLSILGIVFLLSAGASAFIGILSLLLSIVGVIMGILALKEIKKNPETLKGKRMASLGIILGLLWFTIWLILLFIWVSGG